MAGMVSRDIFDLEPEMREKTVALLAACAQQGVEMRPFTTIRDVWAQAKLWRQSRTRHEIEQQIEDLEKDEAPFLAQVIREIGSQQGKWATNAVPGFSWHQHGMALDCYWVVGGNAEWSTTDGDEKNGYVVYAGEAASLGLNAGGHWNTKDWVHVQLPKESAPNPEGEAKEIDRQMRRRFSPPMVATALPLGFPGGVVLDG